MLELNKDNFEDEVLNATGVVAVDFWGEHCQDCLMLMPEYETLASKYGDKIKFTKVNIKGNRRLAVSQKVMGLPAIVIYINGEKIEQISGEDAAAESLEQTIKKYI